MVKVEQCPICGGYGKSWKSGSDKCQSCGTIYQNPRHSNTWLKEYYRSGKYHEDFPSNFNRESIRADRIIMLTERLKIKPKRCLDVGCGSGILLKHLEIFNFARVQGLEYNSAISNMDEVVYSKEEVEGKFDLITCIHVLEHMPNPSGEIKWMLSKLNEGGTIILEVPMYESDNLSHLYVFTRDALEMMLNNLNLNFAYLEYNSSTCYILIGDRYKNSTSEKVYYSFDSPDFSGPKEYLHWLKNSY